VSPDDVVERLRPENKALCQRNGLLRPAGEEPNGSRHRVRRVSSWAVLAMACVLAMTSVLVVFVRNEALDTDTYVATVQPLASDPAVQSAVADAVSAQLVAGTDLKQQVANALPTTAAFLATPITAGLKTVVRQITLRFVQSEAFRTLWTTINRGAHQQLVGLLTGSRRGPLLADRGGVKLDLGKVTDQVRRQLDANGITIFDGVGSSGSPQLILFKSTQLEWLQSWIRTLDRLALLLPIVTLGLFAGGVLSFADRRRGFVRATIGLSIAMAGLLVAFEVGRHRYLDALSGITPHDAAAASYDILTAPPLDTVRTILAVAVVAALIGVAMGSSSIRSRARAMWPPGRRTAGTLHRMLSTYVQPLKLALFGIGMLVMVIWDNVAIGLPIVIVACLLALVDRRRSNPGAVVAAVDDGPGGTTEGEAGP